ncbi:MAG: hypothetical protein COA67_05270 [Lutibacter sp.]|nr:MAG: hypothetical protein COA67_05270 [Lutibacter sp.]
MKKIILFISIILVISSCAEREKVDIESFKIGKFEIPAEKKIQRTVIIRTGSLQIETYGNRTDTLAIHWKNSFNYTLKMLHPKTDLDNQLINVKITGIKVNSYTFEAVIGHSNYVQKGTVYKLLAE